MKKLLLLALVLFAFQAQATEKNSVIDARGNPVRDARNSCVRHDWNSGVDPCAPPPPPAPVAEPVPQPEPIIAPSPARQLVQDDRTVYFDFNKSDLTAEGQAKLDSLAQILKSSEDVKGASIVGFADSMGNDKYNEALSQKRATAVQSYLAEKGFVKTELAKTEWVGESQPTASCADVKKRADKIACLAQDRKVEVKIQFLQ